MNKLIIWAISIFYLGAFVAPIVSAQEEQIVIEDLSPRQLRQEIDKIQTEFYRVFNQLNEDDKFDIVCHSYTPTGTRIAKEACEPQFVIDRRGENAKQFQERTDDLLTPEALLDQLQSEMEQLTEKMNNLSEENQYFRELNQILSMLRGRLEELTN